MGGCGNLKGRRDDGVGSGEVRCSFVAAVRYAMTSLLFPSSDHLAPLATHPAIPLVSYQYPDPPDASDLLHGHRRPPAARGHPLLQVPSPVLPTQHPVPRQPAAPPLDRGEHPVLAMTVRVRRPRSVPYPRSIATHTTIILEANRIQWRIYQHPLTR